ncbi:MAG: hypothetical protein IKQ97_00105 [Eubacterium sp.]|nr:hypothetical protein [Eubacterium sp.]
MKRYDESMYWLENDSWYRVNYEKNCIELTPEAPERAVESFQRYLVNNDLPVVDRQAMASTYKAQVAEYGMPISEEQYQDLREYANDRSIRLSGFRSFVGDTSVIKTVIDDINEIGNDFPVILDERIGVVLEFDYGMKDDDFATTDSGHVIHLNAFYFSDIDKLKEAYNTGVSEGDFVAKTDWRAVARHEAGHVVANNYRLDPMSIMMELLDMSSKAALFYRLEKELSIYSAAYNDGREIISECFSGYYSKVGNGIADAFVQRCIDIGKAGESL